MNNILNIPNKIFSFATMSMQSETKYYIGSNLRKLRLQKDWQQKEMCNLLEMSQSKYSFIENNHKAVDDLELQSIADKLQVDAESLLQTDSQNIFNSYSNTYSTQSYNCTNNFNPLEEIKNLYERLLQEQKVRYETEINYLKEITK